MERDYLRQLRQRGGSNFNSHAHVERDSDIMSNVDACMDFNSHAHVERDAVEKFPDTLKIEFQLTRSRGAWRTMMIVCTIFNYFNSHAHVERD